MFQFMGKNELLLLLKKQQRRLRRFIKNAEKRGYIFSKDIIPKQPKRVTQASVNRLKKLTPDVLYKKAKYITQDGETVTGTKGRQIERKKSADKRKQTLSHKKQVNDKTPVTHSKHNKHTKNKQNLPHAVDTIIGNMSSVLDTVESEISNWNTQPNWSSYWVGVKEQDKNTVNKLLTNAIIQYGYENVAKRLQEHGNDIERIINSILYGSDREQIQFDLIEFATILHSRPLTLDESATLTESLETMQGYEK